VHQTKKKICRNAVLLHLSVSDKSDIGTVVGDIVGGGCERIVIANLAFRPTSTMGRKLVRCIGEWPERH